MQTSFNLNPYIQDVDYFSNRGVLSMKTKQLFRVLGVLTLISVLGCSKGFPVSPGVDTKRIRICFEAGVSFFDETDECNSLSQGADLAVRMTGDLEGVFTYSLTPSNALGTGSTWRRGENTSLARRFKVHSSLG